LAVYEIDPQNDPRWTTLVESHPQSSVFHTRQWLEALRRTYGFKPKVFTTSPAGTPLTNGIAFCDVNSWLTGPRLVSLPFSDHCEPLVGSAVDLQALLSESLQNEGPHLKYLEIRPRSIELGTQSGFRTSAQYCFHVLRLQPSIETLHGLLHKDSVQRKIRRAQRERVVLSQGRSKAMLKQFYELMVLTRRRHRLPPQPLAWFRNLVECFGDRLVMRVASVDNRAIAGILTLRHKQTMVYKYGCSDARFHNLGGMPLLFWQTIQEAKSENLQELDLGRSEPDNAGLIRFKDHLGAEKTTLQYWRLSREFRDGREFLQSQFVRTCLAHLPDNLLQLAGRLLYKHAG
jgi:CelD/BcsL family acetyltransferase involved in cellulose biosynthesis